ncbi:MAG: hypothetical protein K2X55_30535 [Burkholderiaceae bacterium]|nr:hypothetical protein [Burkholderiaceae bacterium]
MAVVSKWLCGSCIAQDVIFAFELSRKELFVVCAACSATRFAPPIELSEILEMGETARNLGSGWTLANIEEVKSAGYECQIDLVYPDFYERIFSKYPDYQG